MSTNKVVDRTRPKRLGIAALAAVVLIMANACTSGGPGNSTPSPTAAASGCVSDPTAVISKKQSATSLTGTLTPALTAQLDAAAQSSFAIAATPGAIVGVRTPKGTWTAAYGMADPSTKAPMTTAMHTRVGSITKTFTVTLLMQLAQEGKLSLDDSIGRYVSGIPNGNTITLRQLADMTSGVASYTNNEAFTAKFFANPQAIFTPTELVAAGVADSPSFKPGTEFYYSNTNIVLLGLVIEKVTGQPFEHVLDEKIVNPLGLTNTTWPGEKTDLPEPYAQGFTLQSDTATPSNPTNATNWNPSWGYSAGELISNLTDMLSYGRALGTGQGLLDTASQTERLTSFSDIGYGLGLVCNNGWVGHTGTMPGYTTTVFYDTTSETSVVVLVNSDVNSGNCDKSPTLSEDPGTAICLGPAVRIFEAVSKALGNPYIAKPAH